MKIILDMTVSKVAKADLFDGKKLIASKTTDSPLGAINHLVKKHRLNLSTLEFEMKEGPGSFTGLRVGAAIINTVNWLRGKKKLTFPKYS